MGDTCRVSILGKNFKGKVSKSQRKQINNCKIEKLLICYLLIWKKM